MHACATDESDKNVLKSVFWPKSLYCGLWEMS